MKKRTNSSTKFRLLSFAELASLNRNPGDWEAYCLRHGVDMHPHGDEGEQNERTFRGVRGCSVRSPNRRVT